MGTGFIGRDALEPRAIRIEERAARRGQQNAFHPGGRFAAAGIGIGASADAVKVPVEVPYVGFDIPNEFVVGYGLDYSEQYRGLPFVGVLKPQVYGAA